MDPSPKEASRGRQIIPSVLSALRDNAARARQLTRDPLLAHFAKNVAWSAVALGFERLVALVQAFVIARMLGVELFGKYGLMFTTIGLLSSLAGLQLGLTAAVQISRLWKTDPRRAGAVLRLCEWVSGGLALLAVAGIALAPKASAAMLLGDARHADVILAGAMIALFSVVGGVQEGILQGLEAFTGLALVRLLSSAVGLGLIFLLARSGDLASIITALAAAGLLRALALVALKEIAARRLGLVTGASDMWRARGVILSFSLPSMLVSLTGGGVGWYGLYALSGMTDGFKEIAYVTAAQQWRGMVLFGAGVLASVAVPMMSRLNGTGDRVGVRQIHLMNVAANVGAATLVVVTLITFSGWVLAAYGQAFLDGRLIFIVVLATTLPAVYIIVLQNYFVSHGRMWEQLAYTCAQSAPLLLAYWLLVPRYGALGYAIATLVITLATSAIMHVIVAGEMGRTKPRSDS